MNNPEQDNSYELNDFRTLGRVLYPLGKAVGLAILGLGILAQQMETVLLGAAAYGFSSLRHDSLQDELNAKRFEILQSRLEKKL